MKWTTQTTYPDVGLRAKWEEFLAAADYPSHYTSPAYFTDPFVRGGQRFAVLALDDAGSITAVLTGIDSGKKIFSGLATRPQLTFRLGNDKQRAVETLAVALDEIGGGDLELTQLYAWKETPECEQSGFRAGSSSDSVVMIDLAVGAEEIFKRFSQTRRNELRKALKQNDLEIGELNAQRELDQLYELHKSWNARKGKPADSFEDLRLAADQPENRRIFVARRAGKVVAASYFRFCRGGIVEYAANNSLTEYQKLRPNDLLVWHAIRWACDEGFRLFSMGGSHLFLRRFGGELWQTSCYTKDKTFLKRHQSRERLQSIASGVYRSLPRFARDGIKSIREAAAG